MIQLPVYALYHAPHLYTLHDVESLLPMELFHDWSLPHRSFPILSGSTGKHIQAENMRLILRETLSEVFLKQMRFDLVAEALPDALKSAKNGKIV